MPHPAPGTSSGGDRPEWTVSPELVAAAAGAGDVASLVQLLDGSEAAAEEAQQALINIGPAALEPLIAATPRLGRYGKLCAIEVLIALRATGAGPVLTELLDSEHETVRAWAAHALGELQVVDAIPRLRFAYQATRKRGTPLDESEPEAIRDALTALGARHPVVPDLVAKLRTDLPTGGEAWPISRLSAVLDELARHGQVILYIQIWAIEANGKVHWVRHDRVDDTLPWDREWPDLVSEAHLRARLEAGQAPSGDNLFATISWIDASDR
jgi:hypothetical protein